MEQYRYECPSVDALVQRAVVLAQKGYVYFLQGELRAGRDPSVTDEKLLEKADARQTKDQRYTRKRKGKANAHYFRWGRLWVVMMTEGSHPMKERNAKERLLDLRNRDHAPLRLGPYSVKLRLDNTPKGRASGRHRASVRLTERAYSELKTELLEIAMHRSAETLAARVFRLAFQPYGPVYRQILAVVKAVNVQRRGAGYVAVPLSCVRFRRDLPKHFVCRDDGGIEVLDGEVGRGA